MIHAIHLLAVRTVIVDLPMDKLFVVVLLDLRDHHHLVDQNVSLVLIVRVTELAVIRNASILVLVLVDYLPNVL